MLWEEDLRLAPIQGPPPGNPALEGPPDAIGDGGLPELVLHSLENGDGEDACDLQQFLHAWPYLFEGVRPGTPVPLALLLGWQLRILVDPACTTFADTGLGRRNGLGVVTTLRHVTMYLLIGDVEARHRYLSLLCSIGVPIPPLHSPRSEPPRSGFDAPTGHHSRR